MWLDAIEADYKGGKVFSVPAPASGAMFISALGLLSTFDHEGEGNAIDLHRTTEAMKVCYNLSSPVYLADGSSHLG
jgi:gamma-glutamyltranspeptidase/glutathione hydrolase